MDITVALSGHSGLEDALKESYVKLETLDGSNQYFCAQCQKLVDAKRVSCNAVFSIRLWQKGVTVVSSCTNVETFSLGI